MTDSEAGFDADYTLDDRYTRESGRVYLSGVQALVRLPLMQRARDEAAGLRTAGFISGYRGSPLGTYDMALWQARTQLEARDVRFEPGVNEDLAATAVWGSQQAGLYPGPRYDGVFGIWYGKGPGVDRSCDALKHANYAGCAPHGGVLALAGDDPGAKSSSIAHQSEQALIHCGIPILNPSSVQDYLDFGLYGWALSRYAGCWVGFKCLTDTVESAASVEVGADRVRIALPEDFERSEGLHIGWSNLPAQVERRLFEQRLPAAQAFVRANGLDRVVLGGPRRRLGIVTTGKAYLDVRQALDELGIDAAAAAELGLSIYKVALTWPLEPVGAREFAAGLDDVLVIEEKRPILEEQLARLLFNLRDRPRLEGKLDSHGRPLVSNVGELSPGDVVTLIRGWLERCAPESAEKLRVHPTPTPPALPVGLMRLPAFCSGCPHNSSTVVPDGSLAQGGIGCHGMAVWLPDRPTLAVTHMGGEGSNWIGSAPFTDTPHIFQNIGDGTYFHSGLLAIRAAVAAGVNITYKILANGAVAMTGGQPIEGERMEGEITVPEIARQLAAEGVRRIAVLSNEPEKYGSGSRLPDPVTLHHRDRIDGVQRELREWEGVSALIYDQTCAAEARRLRRKGEFPDPDRRIVINERVCEGCGDCSVQSNCISIEPLETEFGRKRRINQSSCNKDYSCIKGQCPSFVSVVGGRLRKTGSEALDPGGDDPFAALPTPDPVDLETPFDILVTGIGGSGVITVGALLGMAAHLEGRGCSVLDVTGLAQKNGPVTSHVRLAARPDQLHATRIANGAADLLLGSDIIVTTGPENLSKLAAGTTAVVNSHVTPTSDFASNPDLDLSGTAMQDAIGAATGADHAHFVPASRLASALLGDAIFTNAFLMGFAYQRGRLPLGLPALERAFELNGRAVEANRRAFAWGRLAAHDLPAVERAARPGLRASEAGGLAERLDDVVERRVAFLTDYWKPAYAERYRSRVAQVAEREGRAVPGSTRLAEAVARYLFKLMAVKDEFEVARLYADGSFQRQLDSEFEGDYKVEVHFAPPSVPILDSLIDRRDPDSGRMKKMRLAGWWFFPAIGLLARLRFLRGTRWNPFASEHRRFEWGLIDAYQETLDELLDGLTAENLDLAIEIASLPEHIRGFEEVRERHVAEAATKREELLAAFRLRAPGAGVQPL